jgi:hypothetical protein
MRLAAREGGLRPNRTPAIRCAASGGEPRVPKSEDQGRVRETALYRAVKRHLEALGYEVKGEVRGCDVVGVRIGEAGERPRVAVAELKLGFTLELVLQGVDRLAVADEVWLAVRAARRGRDRDRRIRRLCRLLGFGLVAVDPSRQAVEIVAEPAAYQLRRNVRRRGGLLTEHARRRGDPSEGGSARAPVMTAYRQRALACAAALAAAGPRRPRDLADLAPDAGRILLRDVYGWFERVGHGVYRIAPAGEAALRRWPTPDGSGP